MEEEHYHHHHHHHHEHSVADFQQLNHAFYIGIGLNLLYTVIEFVVGFSVNPLVPIPDASHNPSDVASLVTSLIGMKLAHKAAIQLYTYGYKKASIFTSLIDAVLLTYIAVKVFIEAFERPPSSPEMAGSIIMVTALIGVIIDTISASLSYRGQQTGINIKGTFLHLVLDILVSVGVAVSGTIIYFTGWNIVDPISSFVVAIVISFSIWGLLRENVKLILDGVPVDVDGSYTREQFEAHPSVAGVHHTHTWAPSSPQNALTAHIVLRECLPPEEVMGPKKELKRTLLRQHISHVTLEIDVPDCRYENKKC